MRLLGSGLCSGLVNGWGCRAQVALLEAIVDSVWDWPVCSLMNCFIIVNASSSLYCCGGCLQK
jgi:hypothetical protein